MLKVKTYIKPSEIHGIGLYAGEDIQAGTVVGKLNEWDLKIPVEEVPEELHESFGFYFSLQGEGTFYQTYFDNMRFMNHSDDNNCVDHDDVCVAVRSIKKGEELTCDYTLFDEITQKQGI